MEEINEKSVRSFRVVVTGPESSGKTTLAKQLSEYYRSPLVPEYSRFFLNQSKGKYTDADVLKIAKEQYGLQQSAEFLNPRIIISDTGLLVMKVWSSYKYGTVDPWIEKHLPGYADLYLLCRPDLEWVYDPLRENPDDRDALFELYLKILNEQKANYFIIEGEERFESAVNAIRTFV